MSKVIFYINVFALVLMSFYWSININKYILKPTKTAIHLWFLCDIVQGTLIIIIWKACSDFLSRHKLAKGNSLFPCSEYERCHHKILVPSTCSIIVLEIPSYTKLVIGYFIYISNKATLGCVLSRTVSRAPLQHIKDKSFLSAQPFCQGCQICFL